MPLETRRKRGGRFCYRETAQSGEQHPSYDRALQTAPDLVCPAAEHPEFPARAGIASYEARVEYRRPTPSVPRRVAPSSGRQGAVPSTIPPPASSKKASAFLARTLNRFLRRSPSSCDITTLPVCNSGDMTAAPRRIGWVTHSVYPPRGGIPAERADAVDRRGFSLRLIKQSPLRKS